MPEPSRGGAAAFLAAALVGIASFASLMSSTPSVAATASAPAAIYTPAQAVAGAKVYAAQCAQCHGEQLEGNVGPALKGPNLVRLAKKTKLSVGDVFSFMALQMPLNAPASLSHDQYVQIMAFILKSNGYPAGKKPLTYDAAMRANVVMTTYHGK